ncbi:MAG TPA: PKD domain-containing protein, partial [Methanocella sp.]
TIFNIPAHQYNDDGDYSLNVTVTDADSSWRKATVTVNNLAPAKISMSGTATAYNGEPFSRQLTFVDPGNDSWSAYVDYGDGTNASIVAVGRTFSLPAHTYTRNDNYTMKVIVTDDDGASGTGTFLITVTDKPLLDILISPIALVGYVVITAILVMLGIVYRKRKK